MKARVFEKIVVCLTPEPCTELQHYTSLHAILSQSSERLFMGLRGVSGLHAFVLMLSKM